MEKFKYKCKKCGYVYDPDKGDRAGGINPGTLFEDLPDDWVCPICKAGKNGFIKASLPD
jgi:rubredoxin